MDSHKSRCLLRLALWILAGLTPAFAETRAFTLSSGSKLEAEVVDVSARMVTLRVNGKDSDMAMSQFSEADREYLRGWMRQHRGLYDWPVERGRSWDGTTDERMSDLQPEVAWRSRVGAGDAAVVVESRGVVTTGVRDGKFQVTALAPGDGRQLWQTGYKLRPGGGKATASAAIDSDETLVVTVGPGGRVDAWELKDGKNRWSNSLPIVYHGSELPAGGNHGSPVLDGGHLFIEVGGPAHSLARWHLASSRRGWHIGKHGSAGASPVLATLAKREVIVSRNQYGLVGRDVVSGKMAWDHPWEAEGRASPVVIGGDRVFVTSEKACAMIQISSDRASEVWTNSELCSGTVSPVFYDGYLYGFHGDDLTCIEAASGKVAWRQPAVMAGNLIRAADKLLIQTGKSGELVIAAADPEKFVEHSRSKVFEGESRTVPVFASSRIYCRSAAGEVTCLDARAEEK